MEMKNMSVCELVSLTASDAPAPGGGSISALAAAFAAALSSMVANLTNGRKRYLDAWPQMQSVLEHAPSLCEGLLEDMQKDTDAFDQVMHAMSMPRTTPREKVLRNQAMQKALKEAAEVPLSVARKALSVLTMAETVLHLGNPNAATDALVSCMLARTATLGALANVKINLASIQDEEYVRKKHEMCETLWSKAIQIEARALKYLGTLI